MECCRMYQSLIAISQRVGDSWAIYQLDLDFNLQFCISDSAMKNCHKKHHIHVNFIVKTKLRPSYIYFADFCLHCLFDITITNYGLQVVTYNDVGYGCWRQNVLVTTIRCCARSNMGIFLRFFFEIISYQNYIICRIAIFGMTYFQRTFAKSYFAE